jgi:cytochrome c55X
MMRATAFALSLLLTASLQASDEISLSRQRELANLLTQDCGSCHGLRMKGGLGPALLPENLSGKSADYLAAVILDGRSGSAMPPWNTLLSPAEARWIAARLLQGPTP